MAKLNLLKAMEGQEVWTDGLVADRFGERVCVGIDNGECVCNGKRFKPTNAEIKELWKDHIHSELGSDEEIKAMLKAEFGGF